MTGNREEWKSVGRWWVDEAGSNAHATGPHGVERARKKLLAMIRDRIAIDNHEGPANLPLLIEGRCVAEAMTVSKDGDDGFLVHARLAMAGQVAC